MNEDRRLPQKVYGFEIPWAIGASLVFHVLLVLLLTTPPTSYPSVETITRFDVFWVTPSSVPLHIPAKAGVSAPLKPSAFQQKTAIPVIVQPRTGTDTFFARLSQEQGERKQPVNRLADVKITERDRAAPDGISAQESEREQRAALFEKDYVQTRLAALQKARARGLVVASMRGDLKLVATGNTGIKLSVQFRAYPKSYWSRVTTRSEARRRRAIVPVLATARGETREAVIDTAREGIYVFSAEPEHGKVAKASFTLKVFESGTREKIAALGSRTISRKTVLVKVLMPEAILWDDESAFTGSLEDSEGVTKFNAVTGLYWKEFND